MTLLTAPAKLNLCLFLGPRRDDGLHEICSLFEPISLADLIRIEPAARDEVVCPVVEGENLAERALAALRGRGWSHGPIRVEIEKRIPVAAGLGGGSADAAAVLRLAEGQVPDLERLAAELGADVPSQLHPHLSLVGGAGELVEPLPWSPEHAFVLLPLAEGLSTAEVYAEADRLGLGRARDDLAALRRRLRTAAFEGPSPLGYAHFLANDLQPAALSLRPEIGETLGALEESGAASALVSGSGPTVFGLFPSLPEAEIAKHRLAEHWPGALTCEPGWVA